LRRKNSVRRTLHGKNYKPLTFEDYASVKKGRNKHAANFMIKALNKRIECGEREILAWSGNQELPEIMSIVNKPSKNVG